MSPANSTVAGPVAQRPGPAPERRTWSQAGLQTHRILPHKDPLLAASRRPTVPPSSARDSCNKEAFLQSPSPEEASSLEWTTVVAAWSCLVHTCRVVAALAKRFCCLQDGAGARGHPFRDRVCTVPEVASSRRLPPWPPGASTRRYHPLHARSSTFLRPKRRSILAHL